MSFLAHMAALPGSVILTLLSMIGLAAWPRQIVRVWPKNPAALSSKEEDVATWISKNVPSLKETFKPAWWLPK